MAFRAWLWLTVSTALGCNLTFVDEAGFQSSQLPPEALVVDIDSVGGPCNDERSVQEARDYATPWCTLGRALAAAPRGSTVFVRRGTYPQLVFRAAVGRSAELRISPYPFEQAQIAGMRLEGQQFLRFQGFHFTEAISLFGTSAHIHIADCDITSSIEASGVTIADEISDFTLEGCQVHDLPGSEGLAGRGVTVARGGTGIRILQNTFSNLGSDGVWMTEGNDVLIESNTLSNVLAPFYFLASSDVKVRNNKVLEARSSIWLQNIQQLEVTSNLFTGFPLWAVSFGNIPGARIINNTVWGNGKGGVTVTDGSGAPTSALFVQNNILQSLEGPSVGAASISFEDYNLIGFGYRAGAHDLSAAPLFMDTTQFDFHLAPGSPGIDAALAEGAPSTDADGRSRVDDSSVVDSGSGTPSYGDLGAFEGR